MFGTEKVREKREKYGQILEEDMCLELRKCLSKK